MEPLVSALFLQAINTSKAEKPVMRNVLGLVANILVAFGTGL
jgi:hypothetical protein